MINIVRTRAFWPVRRFFVGFEKEEAPKPAIEEKPKSGFFDEFLKMWEVQADLVVRNIED